MRKLISKKSWMEFKKTGLLWFVNRILHAFGWVIVYEWDDLKNDSKEPDKVYAARTRYRGFTEDVEEGGFISLSNYMLKHSQELLKEIIRLSDDE